MFRKAKTTGEKNKYLCFTACVLIAISIFPPYLLAVGPGETLAKSLTGSRDWIYVLAIAGAAAMFTAAGMYLPVVTLGIAGLAVFFSENNTTAAELGREIERLANYQIVNGPGRYVLLLGAGTLILFALIGIFIPGENKTGASQIAGGRMSLRQLLADLTVEEEAQP